MINLLAKEYRRELSAAKRNIILRKYLLILTLLAVLVAA